MRSVYQAIIIALLSLAGYVWLFREDLVGLGYPNAARDYIAIETTKGDYSRSRDTNLS